MEMQHDIGSRDMLLPGHKEHLDKIKYFIRYTLDGEILVHNSGSGLEDHPLKTVSLMPTPSFVGDKHIGWMSQFYNLIKVVKQKCPSRLVPLTRKEVIGACADKRIFHEVMRAGLVKEALIPLLLTTNGKPSGARAVIYFTPQGRAFIRKHIDPDYAITENT
jgi:hypothetical protein